MSSQAVGNGRFGPQSNRAAGASGERLHSPAPSPTSSGRKRSRGRQSQPAKLRRRRSGSEEWTPPQVDGEAVSGSRPAASGMEESVDGAHATTSGGNYQKGCGNPVVQVSRELKQTFDTHISEQLRQCTVSVTDGGPEHAPVLGRVLQLACMALRDMLDTNVVTVAHVRTQFGDFQAEHRARQSSPTKKQAQRRIGVRMPTDVLPLIVDTLGILSAARLWGANRMLIEFMFLCCMGRIPGIPTLVTPEVVVSATTGGPVNTAAVSGATRADSSVSNARAQAGGRSISVCGARQHSPAASPRSPHSPKRAALKVLHTSAGDTVARVQDPSASADGHIFRGPSQASKDAATIAAMAAGGGFPGLKPFPASGNPFQQAQLPAPGDGTFRGRQGGAGGAGGFRSRSPLGFSGAPLSHAPLGMRSAGGFGGPHAAEGAAGAGGAGAAGSAGGGDHALMSTCTDSAAHLRHHAADARHSRGALRSTASASPAVHPHLAAPGAPAPHSVTHSQQHEDLFLRPCHSEPAKALSMHSVDGPGASLPRTPTSFAVNQRNPVASCSSAPFAFSMQPSVWAPNTSAAAANSTSTATNVHGMLHGNLAMPKATGDIFPVGQHAPGQPLRRMASLYTEVTDCRTSASDSAMAAARCDRGGTQAAHGSSGMAGACGMTMSDKAPVLFKEDTLKTLQREAAHLGSKKPSASEPATSQCSDHMQVSGVAQETLRLCEADCNMAPSPPHGPAQAANNVNHNNNNNDNNANSDAAWALQKLAKQPTLSVLCSDVPGSWDPLMAFPVEIAKEGSGEHSALREGSLNLLPHSAGLHSGGGGGTSTPALRIEVLNTGLQDSHGGDSKRASCTSSSIYRSAMQQHGALRSSQSAPGPAIKDGGLKRSGESCMADVFASLNAQSHAFSSADTATAGGGGMQMDVSGPALAEGGSAGHGDAHEQWPQLGQDISFAVPDVLERSGDFGTKPLKALVSSGLWKIDTADMRTLELDMAAMDKAASEHDLSGHLAGRGLVAAE